MKSAIVREVLHVVQLLFDGHRLRGLSRIFTRRFFCLVKPALESRPQLREAVGPLGGNRDDLQIGKSLLERAQILCRVGQIHLVGDHVPGSLRKPRIIKIDLAPSVLQIFDRVPAFASRTVEDEKQDAAARDVAKKIVTEADVAMCSLDQSGNIGNRGAAIAIEINHADHRMKRGKRIGRDLRVRGRDFSEQGRLAGIRITHERSVGHRPKLEKEVTLLALFAFRVLDGSAIPRTLEMNVALSATSTLAENEFLAVVGEIGDWIGAVFFW